jgi:hypothetical protein
MHAFVRAAISPANFLAGRCGNFRKVKKESGCGRIDSPLYTQKKLTVKIRSVKSESKKEIGNSNWITNSAKDDR